MMSLTSEELQGLQTQWVDRLEQLLTQTEKDPIPEPFNNLEILSNQVVQIVAGFVSLRPKESEKEQKLFVEVFNKLMVLKSRIKEYYHLREAFLSADRKFDLYDIVGTISQARTYYTKVLNHGEPQ